MQNSKKLFLAACLMLHACSAKTETIQDVLTPSVLNDTSKVVDINEVTVTARTKDAFILRRQPVSSSSFSTNDIHNLGAEDLQDLALHIPSFCMPDYGARLTSSMYIRGIGSRINSPAVTIYMDDMPIVSKCGLNFHTYQTERVDVLRGPQATLYGQNSEGGLIRLYSKDPSHFKGTDLRFSLGNRMTRNVEAAHYTKASNIVAYSIAAFYNGTNGYLHNTTTHKRADRTNEVGSKMQLVLTPSQRLTLRLIADYQFTDQHAFAYGSLNTDNQETQSPASNRMGTYRRNLLFTGLSVRYKTEGYSFNSTTSYQYLNDHMLMDQDYMPTDYMHLIQKQIQNAITQELTVKSEHTGTWHWTFGAFASHQWLHTDAPVYFGEGITRPISDGVQREMYNSVVNAMTQRFIATGMDATSAESMAKSTIERAGGISLGINMDAPGKFHTPQMNLGLFHESNIELLPRLTLTLGLRYDLNRCQIEYDTKAAMSMTASVMGKEATYTLTSRLNHKTHNTFHQILPKVGLSFTLDNQHSNVYATVSKGYRTGGYNIQMFSDILQTELTRNRQQAMSGDYDVPHTADDINNVEQTIAYHPETSVNYEVGAHLNLARHKLQLDLATYLMKVHDLQLSVMAGTYGYGRMMVNAGRSQSYGFETTLRGLALSERLSWSIGYSFTHSVFKDYAEEIVTNGETTRKDYKDNFVPYVPQHTLSASADYRFDFQNQGLLRALVFGASLSAQGKIYWDETNAYAQNFYALLGAHIDADFGLIGVSLWGKNLTQTRYNTFAVSSAATGTTAWFAQQGAPFMCGVEIRLRF